MTTFALMMNDALWLVVAAAVALTAKGVAAVVLASPVRKLVASFAAVADHFGLQLTHDQLIVLSANTNPELEDGQ